MSSDRPDQPSGSAPDEPTTTTTSSDSETKTKSSLNRRKFLTAAALGTAAAAFLQAEQGNLSFGPLSALANDLSGNPCTAQDVEIIGNGITQNEPCNCSGGGTFTAHVQFTVRNNTSTGRYCIALHLPSGFGVPGQDVILRDVNGSSTAPGKSGGESFHDTTMFGDVVGFPCNSGGSLVCIGQSGVTTGKCAPNTCTTIAWNTSPGAAGCSTADQKPPGGQCRHQGICIQGFGATLDCTSGCDNKCGGTAVLRACVNGGTSPYSYTLTGSDGSSQTFPASGTTTDTCHDFTVTLTKDTTYTCTVTDSKGCSRQASKPLSASPIDKPTISAGKPDCAGQTTLTASPSGLASYTWFDGNTQIGTGNPLTVTLTPGDHSITVTVTNSANCSATSDATTVHVNQPVSTSLDTGNTQTCTSDTIFTATASGGAGGFTFEWKVDSVVQSTTGNTLTYARNPDCSSHTISVKATDKDGCPSGNTASRTITQTVQTSVS